MSTRASAASSAITLTAGPLDSSRTPAALRLAGLTLILFTGFAARTVAPHFAVPTAARAAAPTRELPGSATPAHAPTHEHLGFFDDRDRSSPVALEATTDLPVVEIVSPSASSEILAIIISGDGGWNGLDRRLGKRLAERGVSVVGLDSKLYFATARSPHGASRDVARLLRHYLGAWGKERAMLIGYSRGADVLPFIAAHLPADLRSHVALVAIVGSDGFAQFENGTADQPDTRTLEVLPEILTLRGMNPICVYGVHEAKSVCTDLDPDQAGVLARPGDHAFRNDDAPLAKALIYESGEARRRLGVAGPSASTTG